MQVGQRRLRIFSFLPPLTQAPATSNEPSFLSFSSDTCPRYKDAVQMGGNDEICAVSWGTPVSGVRSFFLLTTTLPLFFALRYAALRLL